MSHLVLVDYWSFVLDLSGRPPHPPLLQARNRLDEFPYAFEEQIIVIVQRVHRSDGEVHLDDVRGRFDVDRQ